MPLTNEQVQLLFAFTKKKLVRYYDLELELVDHVAERVEEEMEINPGLTFENALQRVYAGFGIFGFSQIVRQKEKHILKQNRKIWLKEIVSFIKLPKIVFTAFFFIALYKLTNIVPLGYLTTIAQTGIIAYFIAGQVIKFRLGKKEIKDLLLLEYSPALMSSLFPILEYSIFFKSKPNAIAFSVAVVLSVILQYSTLEVFKKVRLKAKMLYPHAFA